MKNISVIIPSYNQQDYLADAIDSALGQTVPCEIIVVNDGSTDNSLTIAQKYEGIKLVNQVNKGLSSARNAGIMNATGDYILFLDADDILLPTCVERIIETIESTGADIVSPSFKEFGVRNTQIILMPNPQIEDFKTGNRIGYCSAVKREALLEVGGYSSRMTFGFEDYALWFDLLSRGKKIVTIPEILWLYRTKENSMINDAMAHRDELMAQIYKDFPKIFPEEQKPIINTPLPK
mgnify:CR=1 FL=1